MHSARRRIGTFSAMPNHVLYLIFVSTSRLEHKGFCTAQSNTQPLNLQFDEIGMLKTSSCALPSFRSLPPEMKTFRFHFNWDEKSVNCFAEERRGAAIHFPPLYAVVPLVRSDGLITWD